MEFEIDQIGEIEIDSIASVGPRGYSAYEVAVQNGYEGTEAQWLESLKVKGDKGDKPIKGVDYFTEEDKDELKEDITSDIVDDATSDFNRNVAGQTTLFNTHVENKKTEINQYVNEKTTAFNTNATNKTDNFNSNASSKLDTYNSNHTSKMNAYNQNATDKTTAYNTNATNQTNAYDNNASSKLTAYNDNAESKTTEFNNNAESYDKRITRAEMVYNALPKVNGTGTDITLNDTANAGMDLELEPNISQASTTGKNWFNKNDTPVSADGVIVTELSTGVQVKCNMVNTNLNAKYIIRDLTGYEDKKITVKVHAKSSSTNPAFIYLRIVDSAGNTTSTYGTITSGTTLNGDLTVTMTVPSELDATYHYLLFVLYSTRDTQAAIGDYVDYTNVQVEESASATSYEPYTGKIPAPNPDYPQDVHVVTGDNEIKVQGKNLWSSSWEQGIIDADTGALVNNSNAIRSKDYIFVMPNQHYAIKRSIGTGYTNVRCYDKNKTYLGGGNDYITLISGSSAGNPMQAGDTTCIIAPKDNVYYLKFNDFSNDLSVKYMMIKGDVVPTSYETYQEQTLSLTLDTLEYCKIGDYADRFFKNVPEDEDYDATRELGKWYLKKNIGKYTFNITDNWVETDNHIAGCYTLYKREPIKQASQTYKPFCTNLKGVQNPNYGSNTNPNSIGASHDRFNIYIPNVTTIQECKNTMENNTAYYVLATPTYTLLNDTLQTELNNIEYAVAYDGQTNINQENDDLPFIINAKAVYDLNKLLTRVETLETEV